LFLYRYPFLFPGEIESRLRKLGKLNRQ